MKLTSAGTLTVLHVLITVLPVVIDILTQIERAMQRADIRSADAVGQSTNAAARR